MKTRTCARWIRLLGLVILLAACGRTQTVEIPTTGDIVTERYDLVGFDEVEVAGFFEVEVSHGEVYQVSVKAERALIPYLEIKVRGDRLQVGLKPGISFSFEDASQRVDVTLPTVTHARVSDHSTLSLSTFETGETLRLEAADFSTLRGSIDANDVQVEASNHSSLILTGSASQVTGEVKTFSSADLTRLDTADVDIEVDDKSTLKQ